MTIPDFLAIIYSEVHNATDFICMVADITDRGYGQDSQLFVRLHVTLAVLLFWSFSRGVSMNASF